ncbi:MAG: hypothetical protein IID31_03720 [Planctomycetes bacterium]|nr:hypothetical protein [Planctomycetota bacterium]
MKQFPGLMAGVAMTLAAVLAPAALADDKVVMNDGRVFEGLIVREFEGWVWIKIGSGSLARTELLATADIELILRDEPNLQPEAEAEPRQQSETVAIASSKTPTEPAARTGSAERVAIITLGESGGKDMVGLYMTAHILEEIIPALKKENVDTVVFLINSGGGALLEIQRLSDVIQDKYKAPDGFRTVAWIESAISAAAMTAHCIEEIYFMPEGNYGACTGYRGPLIAMKDRELEEVVYMMEKVSARGGHDTEGQIMRAMQHFRYPLSCDINENGDVTWYQNEEGQHLVNPEGRILTFDSRTAAKYGFSGGTAKTLEELEKVMGLTEVEWVGRDTKGFFYPISRAEEINMRFRDKTYEDEQRTREYFTIYQAAIQLAEGEQDKKRRGKFVGKARSQLNAIVSMVRNNPNLALFVMNMTEDQFEQWVDDQRQLLRDLMR